MECRKYFFDYTDKCAMAFSGKQMGPPNDDERMTNDTEKIKAFNDTKNDDKKMNSSQTRRPSDTMCMEAAKKLFDYKQFGEAITRCECDSYPELCKHLFKNRFLLNKVCS